MDEILFSEKIRKPFLTLKNIVIMQAKMIGKNKSANVARLFAQMLQHRQNKQ